MSINYKSHKFDSNSDNEVVMSHVEMVLVHLK